MFLKPEQVAPDEFEQAVADSMTAKQFVNYVSEGIQDNWDESLYEGIAQHNSEVAMFGDAGPGSGYRLHRDIARYNAVMHRYAILTDSTYHPLRAGLRSPA